MTAACNILHESGGSPRRKLTPQTIERAAVLVKLGVPMVSVAQGIGVHRHTLRQWIAVGTEPGANGLEADLAAAIQRARVEGEAALLEKLHKMAGEGDSRAATWLLSHSPRWRDSWSDASHAKREVQRVVQMFVQALEQDATLRPEQRERVLLSVKAQGLALQAAESEQE